MIEKADQLELPPGAKKVGLIALGAALLCIVLSMLLSPSYSRFLFAYLVALMTFTAIGIGALFFVLIQHLTAAGWSVSVRRIAESISLTLPAMGILALPILFSVLSGDGRLYCWAAHPEKSAVAEHATHDVTPAQEFQQHIIHRGSDELTEKKSAWLNPVFFTLRVIIYFYAWSAIAIRFWKKSVLQDTTADPSITAQLRAASGPCLFILGITLTFASFDLLMSLDPHWYSTMFGVYYFAGAAPAFFATIILISKLLQKRGYLARAISVEHYHDLGKYLFGFIFFWGYIAFSQFMLLWYASLPETTPWLARRGATSSSADYASIGYGINGWTTVALVLLFGHLLIPFVGLISRHAKRNSAVLAFFAVWILVFHALDLYWLVMPESVPADPRKFAFSLIDPILLIGFALAFVGAWLLAASKAALRPTNDPRLTEALAFENI